MLNKLSQEAEIRNFETDFLQRIKPSAVLGYFQEAAGEHSDRTGLGFEKLARQGYFWVLSKIFVEVERRPHFRDKICVETWPHIPGKATYERSFLLSDKEGVAMRACSRWCILRKDGRILPCSAIEQPQLNFIEERSVAFDDWRIPEVPHEGEPAFTLRIANSEYDLNRHVNNIKYADYIFNCFSVRELEEYTLRSFQIHYVRQSYEGDVLSFYREEISPGVYAVEGVKGNGETVICARVCFDRL